MEWDGALVFPLFDYFLDDIIVIFHVNKYARTPRTTITLGFSFATSATAGVKLPNFRSKACQPKKKIPQEIFMNELIK